jgi:outer membrane protein assembly factor BamB
MSRRWLVLILILAMVVQCFLLCPPAVGQLATSASAMYRFNPAHTGQASYPGPVTGRVKWSFPTYHRILSTPAVGSDGTIYVGSGDRRFYAVSPTGGQKWAFVAWGMIDSSPAVSSTGTVYFSAGDSLFYAVDRQGKEAWIYLTKYPNSSSPLLGADNMVYFASGDGSFNAMPADGGKLRWSFQAGAEILSSPSQDTAGNFYFGAQDGYLYSISPTGHLRWKFRTGGSVESSPAIDAAGNVYVGSSDFYLYSLDPSGQLRWSFRTDGPVLSSPALSPDGVVYFGSNDFSLYALKSADGVKLWSFGTESPIDTSPTRDSQGRIYFGGQDKYFYCLRQDGSLLWKLAMPNGFSRSSAVIGPNNEIFVGCLDSRLYCLSGEPAPGPPPSPSPTPTLTPTPTSAPTVSPPISFQLSLSPTSLEMNPGSSASFQLVVNSSETSSLPASLAFVAPPDITCRFSPESFTLSGGPVSVTALVVATNVAPPGMYDLTMQVQIGTAIETVTAKLRILGLSFPDLSTDYWAYPAIADLIQRQVLRGYPDGTFKPANLVTRAEFAKMFLLSFAVPPAQTDHASFPDVPLDHWANRYVEGAVAYGLIKGYPDGTFRPDGRVTLAECLTLIVRARRDSLVNPNNLYLRERGAIRPLSSADWYYQYAGAAFAQGILRADDPHLVEPIQGGAVAPFNDPSTRAQVAVLLVRATAKSP